MKNAFGVELACETTFLMRWVQVLQKQGTRQDCSL